MIKYVFYIDIAQGTFFSFFLFFSMLLQPMFNDWCNNYKNMIGFSFLCVGLDLTLSNGLWVSQCNI